MADYPNACGAGEDMKVDGKAGIGTSSPQVQLHVKGTGGSSTPLIRCESNESQNSFIEFKGDGTGNEWFVGRMDTSNEDSFGIGRTGVAFDVWINSNGAIGVGTTSPSSRLEVDGGDIEVDDSSRGLILRSPDGERWRVQVNNSGSLTTTRL